MLRGAPEPPEPPPVAAAPPDRSPVVAPPEPEARAEDPRDAAEEEALPDPVWDALVAGHLEAEVRSRYGRSLDPEQETRLMDRLREVRDAGDRLETDPGEDALAGARRRLSRTIVLLEADRAFRDELGVGLSEFVRGLGPDQVEDVGADQPPSEPVAEPPEDARPVLRMGGSAGTTTGSEPDSMPFSPNDPSD
jgi:hypothetical protein